jgi:hypothetical protein
MKKSNNGKGLKPGGNVGLQYLVVLDMNGGGGLWIYRSATDMAKASGVNAASIRNLFVGGVDAVDYRGYRVYRVRSYGGVDFWKYIKGRAVKAAKPVIAGPIDVKGVKKPVPGRNGIVKKSGGSNRFGSAFRLRLSETDLGDEVL